MSDFFVFLCMILVGKIVDESPMMNLLCDIDCHKDQELCE